ncbi:lariat debranching enzyme [Anabrus simplex]|uniref:lariat debranching enzyme n=1 Tax=Anabrus simplex TaxID=316456 RepID=UPI0035A2F126
MKVAIEGCAHGELEKIYETLVFIEERERVKIDLLICCGDFQATRNIEDLKCMAVPRKYQSMCSFYKYYSGEKVAPVLTLFIGGNHEASNYLQELPYGGWVAPKIYYVGYAGIVNVAGIRIAGLSGIYKGHDYMKGHFEKPPYTEETKRSVYHIRNLETFRLKQVQQPIDIFLSHDWPRGVHRFGDVQELIKNKPFLENDINSDSLGSKPCEELLQDLKPSYWFSAHLHVKFSALIQHSDDLKNKQTKFLALDKCLPRRKFLQIVDIPHDPQKAMELEYDLEWLTILFLTNHLLSVKKSVQYMPGPGSNERWIFTPTDEEKDLVRRKFDSDLRIPGNFTQTVTPYNPEESSANSPSFHQPSAQINPQTMVFCDRLGVDDPMTLLLEGSSGSMGLNSSQLSGCSPPSFLTPEKPGDITRVSMNDSTDLDDAGDIEEYYNNSAVSKRSSSNHLSNTMPMGRLSLALPSPQNSDLDEPQTKGFCEDVINSSKTQSPTLPSPKDSEGEDVVGTGGEISSSKQSSQEQVPSGTEDEVISETLESHPVVKRFKRRNQEFYTSREEDC